MNTTQNQPMTNEEKIAAAKAFLGEKYLLHPSNQVQKVQPKEPVLKAA